MAKLTGTQHLWIISANREDTDDWPDLQITKQLRLRPDRVVIEYRRPGLGQAMTRDWDWRSIVIHGECYRPLKSGAEKPHGRGSTSYDHRGCPEEYHDLILSELERARREYTR